MSVRFRIFDSGKLTVVGASASRSLVPGTPGKSAVINSMRFTRSDSPSSSVVGYSFTVAVRRAGVTGVPIVATVFTELLTWNMMAIEDREVTLGENDELIAWIGQDGDGFAYPPAIDYIICGIERDA